MKKLEIELFQYHDLLFGKVLHQDDSLRGKGMLAEVDGFSIESEVSPNISTDELYVRGIDQVNDNVAFFRYYSSPEEAKEVAEKIKKCLDIINGDKPEAIAIIK